VGKVDGLKEHRKKFDDIKKAEYLELLREGTGRCRAARSVGVNIFTVERHMGQYPSFADAVSLAETEADDEVENALYQAAISGNVTACQVWLYNRRKDKWTDRRNVRTEITGRDGGPIEVDQVELLEKLKKIAQRTIIEGESRLIDGSSC
jgi:hypothetical protein